jgi:hypothetical protein
MPHGGAVFDGGSHDVVVAGTGVTTAGERVAPGLGGRETAGA